jgi:hypothetical protein
MIDLYRKKAFSTVPAAGTPQGFDTTPILGP